MKISSLEKLNIRDVLKTKTKFTYAYIIFYL